MALGEFVDAAQASRRLVIDPDSFQRGIFNLSQTQGPIEEGSEAVLHQAHLLESNNMERGEIPGYSSE